MVIRILYVHLAGFPRHVDRALEDIGAALPVLRMKCVDVLNENHDPSPWSALRAFAQEDRNVVATDTAECRRITVLPFLEEAQFTNVVVHRPCEVADVKNGGRPFEVV